MGKDHPTMTLTIQQAVKLLGCSEATVWRLLRRGELPRIKLGTRTTRIPADAVYHLIKGNPKPRTVG